MYTKEESKQLKTEFWTKFGLFSQRKRIALGLTKKWLSHSTGINCLTLKFDFDNKKALVGIEINSKNTSESEKYYQRIQSLRHILDKKFETVPIWDEEYYLPDDKLVKKIFHELQEVNIYNSQCWPKVFLFFFNFMLLYEEFYIEFKELIKDDN